MGLDEHPRGKSSLRNRIGLYRPHQEKVEVSYTLPISEKANPQAGDVIGTITYNRTDIDPTLNWIYFNVKTCKSNTAAGITSVQSVYRMNIGTGEFEHYLDLPGIDMMYGFSVSPQGEVYLCDCLDYSAQRGYIRNYKKDGFHPEFSSRYLS